MLLKVADDKQPDIDALELLLIRLDVDGATKARIDREIKNLRAGVQGEREAAYEIDFHYAKHPNRAVVHDLRLEVEGRVAQIDHLIIDRYLTIWVCETKHFAEGVGVNEHGEWVRFFGGRPDGIPSPIEQNRRHIAVLQDVFDRRLVDPKKRFGLTIKPRFKSVILVSNNARISRPKSKAGAAAVDGLDSVIKVEKLVSMILKDNDSRPLTVIGRVVSSDTIVRLGTDLAALHRPKGVDWAARFGLSTEPVAPVASVASAAAPKPRAARVCASCGVAVSYGVARYCEDHAKQFGGLIICMACQRRASGLSRPVS
jgi:hypothetical protein